MHPSWLSCKLTLKTFNKHYLNKNEYFTVFQPRLKRETPHLQFRVENRPETSQVRAHQAAPREACSQDLGAEVLVLPKDRQTEGV